MTTFGYEFEVHRHGLAVLSVLDAMRAVPDSSLHAYHCGCSECSHTNYGPSGEWLFSAQEDCTVSAEFPSKVLTWGTEQAERAFLTMERAAVIAGADLSQHSGMHVHVAKPAEGPPLVDGGLDARTRATWRVLRMFIRYQDELVDIASGWREQVRAYNHPLSVNRHHDDFWTLDLDGPAPEWWDSRARNYYYADPERLTNNGGFLTTARHPYTWEFRLWNASKAAWRQRLCVALSVAMTEAAASGVDVTEHDPRPVEEVLAPWLDDATWAGIIRQKYGKGGLAA